MKLQRKYTVKEMYDMVGRPCGLFRTVLDYAPNVELVRNYLAWQEHNADAVVDIPALLRHLQKLGEAERLHDLVMEIRRQVRVSPRELALAFMRDRFPTEAEYEAFSDEDGPFDTYAAYLHGTFGKGYDAHDELRAAGEMPHGPEREAALVLASVRCNRSWVTDEMVSHRDFIETIIAQLFEED